MSEERKIEAAVAVMKKAIDRAAKETNGNVEWEDIFGSQEKMEYWLDDRNFDSKNQQ